ncbi:MAG: sulfotransferase [Sphingomonadales bacterium]
MSAPIFLYGFARSGTTLLTMMLDSHAELSVPLSVTGLWYRTIAASAQDVDALVDALLGHERIRLWKADLNRDAILAAIRPGHIEDIIPAFHAAKAQADGKPRWANMDIASIDHVEELATWFPDARFVHIVRDVRDVALSHQDYAFSEGYYLEIAQSWSALVGAAERIGSLLGERHLTIHFEDLVEASEATLKTICDHVELEYDATMLAYGAKVGQKIPNERRGLWPDIDKPPQANKVDQWRTRLSKAQRYVVETNARETLQRLGCDAMDTPTFSLSGELYGLMQYALRGHRGARLRRKLGLPQKKVRGR